MRSEERDVGVRRVAVEAQARKVAALRMDDPHKAEEAILLMAMQENEDWAQLRRALETSGEDPILGH